MLFVPKFTRQERLTYALRIKPARLSRGWDQEELAGRSGVSRGTVMNAERGQKAPQSENLWKMMVALDLTADPLHRWAEPVERWLQIIAPLIDLLPDSERERIMSEMVVRLGGIARQGGTV